MTRRCSWIVSATASAACSTCPNPHQPKQIYEKQIGRQLNMVSQSWDGKRLYFSSSLLARWDKGGDDNEQFVRAYAWDGKELKPTFDLDFTALKLGRPHHMLFGSTKIGAASHNVAANRPMWSTCAMWKAPPSRPVAVRRALTRAMLRCFRRLSHRRSPTAPPISLATPTTITIRPRPAATPCRS